ncbi:MAG: transglycosylase domain-containing protein [Actinomycetota bacterium]
MRRRPLLAALLLAALATACGPVVEVAPTAPADLAEPQQTSVVLDADGGVLAELHAEQDRELVALEEVPEVLVAAVLAVEDPRFYDHGGLDGQALARALLTNARQGTIAEGGSTITQQLAKNAVTGDARTVGRKLEEASVALQLEAELGKDGVLERYLNTVYLGNGAYGVAAAARRYFGAEIGELDLGAAALLAGLLSAPSRNDPYAEPERAEAARGRALEAMVREGVIDRARAEEVAAEPLGVGPAPVVGRRDAPYFVDLVVDRLEHDPAFEALGDTPAERADRLFRSGLVVETTLDPAWQEAAEAAVAATVGEPDDPAAAIVAIDPATGAVRGLVGGRDWDDATDPSARFNLATTAARQPASVLKPVVLAAALERGWSLGDHLPAPASLELPADPPEEPDAWEVANHRDHDYGLATLREAVTLSMNTPFAALVDELGPETIASLAADLGVTTPLEARRTLALGVHEVTVLDVATVQATLAAGGVHRRPSVISSVRDAEGQVLYEREPDPGRRVLDPAVAWQVTRALEGVVAAGTGERGDIARPLAAKTGTSQDNVDAWFAGYTPDLAAAVWMGFPEGRVPMEPPTTRRRVDGGTWPAELFARFAMSALEQVPAERFEPPDVDLRRVEVHATADCLAAPQTPGALRVARAFPAGLEPTELCLEPRGAVPLPQGRARAAGQGP